MKKPFALFAIVLLAGAGWFALRSASRHDTPVRDPFAAPTATDADSPEPAPAPALPSAGRTDTIPPRPSPQPSAPSVFAYAESALQPDGSFSVTWNFDATSKLQPGDTLQVRLPFATEPYTAIVEDETTVEGVRRVSGRLQDDRGIDSWPFSITLSTDRKYATANFQTDAAQFSVTADPRGGQLKDTTGEAAKLENDMQ